MTAVSEGGVYEKAIGGFSRSLAYCSSACAQTTIVTTGTAPEAAVTIEPEYRTRIKTYVTEHHIAPAAVGERIVVGATVPQDIELRTAPDNSGPHFKPVPLRLFR